MTIDPSPLQLEVAALTQNPTAIATVAEYHRGAEELIAIRLLDDKITSTFDPIIKSIRASLDTTRQTVADLRAPLAAQRGQIVSARERFEQEEELRRKQADALSIKAAEDIAALDSDIADMLGLGDPSDMSAPAMLSMPVPPQLPKSRGVSVHVAYEAELVDIRELVIGAYEGKVPMEYLSANMPALNAAMRTTKGRALIPGVKVKKKNVTSVRPR